MYKEAEILQSCFSKIEGEQDIISISVIYNSMFRIFFFLLKPPTSKSTCCMARNVSSRRRPKRPVEPPTRSTHNCWSCHKATEGKYYRYVHISYNISSQLDTNNVIPTAVFHYAPSPLLSDHYKYGKVVRVPCLMQYSTSADSGLFCKL